MVHLIPVLGPPLGTLGPLLGFEGVVGPPLVAGLTALAPPAAALFAVTRALAPTGASSQLLPQARFCGLQSSLVRFGQRLLEAAWFHRRAWAGPALRDNMSGSLLAWLAWPTHMPCTLLVM